MKQFSQQLHKKATTTVTLQAAERRELRERVVAYMEYHPLPAELRAKQKSVQVTPVTTEAFAVVKIPFRVLFKYGALATAFVFVTLPFMAQNAIPGDSLYAVKVQFNEELRSTLTFDSLQKVEWETERLNRRLAEARLLASEGRLTEVVEAEVAAAVRTHTENAKREIEVLRTKDADEATIASIALDTTLEVQAVVLKEEEETTTALSIASEEGVSSKTMNSLIADAIDESRDRSIEPGASSTLPAYDKLMARVEQNTTRVYELRSVLGDSVSAEEQANVTRRIEDLERSVESVIILVETDEQAARHSLVEVLQRSQRLILFINELVVAKAVDINTLVPVVLTSEEKSANIASSTESLADKMAQIESSLATVTDEAVVEKVQAGQTTVLELKLKMASSTDEYEAFVAVSQEAHALADDMLILLEHYYTPLPVANEEAAVIEIETTEERSATSELPEQGSNSTEQVNPAVSTTSPEVIDSL